MRRPIAQVHGWVYRAALSRRLDEKGDASVAPDGDSERGGYQLLGLSVEPTFIFCGRSLGREALHGFGIAIAQFCR